MVANLVPMEPTQPDARATLLALIDAERARGCPLPEAASVAARRAIQEGLLVPFWKQHGAAILADLWRRENRDLRRVSRLPGERRVDPTTLRSARSLLDGLWQVGESWLPLGDFLRIQLEEVAATYESQEKALAAKRRALLALAEGMKSRTRSVREVYTEEQVRAIFRAGKAAPS